MNINNLGNSYSTYNYHSNTNKTERTDKTFSLDKTENTSMSSKLSEQIQRFIEEHKLTAQELKDEKDWRDITDEEWEEMLGNVDEYLDDVKEYLERMKEMQDEAAMKAATLADSGLRANAASTAALNVAANISGATTGDFEEVDEETENPNEEEVGSKNWTKNLETDDQLVLRVAQEAQKMENMSLSKLQEVQLTDNTTVGISESDKLKECASISEDEKHEKIWTITAFTEEGITSNKCQNGRIIDSWNLTYKNTGDYKKVWDYLDQFDKDDDFDFAGSKEFWEEFLANME